MAEINIERKKPIWPWILAALAVALLIWGLVEMLGRDGADGAADQAAGVATADQTTVASATGAAGAREGLSRYAGTFESDSMQLRLNADGTYTMRESAAGEGHGTWMHNASANALHLTPADGSQDRYFRAESADTLTPLNPDGAPAAEMSQLTRRAGE